jgi:hypothetical protein
MEVGRGSSRILVILFWASPHKVPRPLFYVALQISACFLVLALRPGTVERGVAAYELLVFTCQHSSKKCENALKKWVASQFSSFYCLFGDLL